MKNYKFLNFNNGWSGKIFVIILLIIFQSFATAQMVFINEVMSSNNNAITDEDGDTPDWFELYNAGESSINLAGFGISDDAEDPFKWLFPLVTIDPQSHLLVFASSKNRTEYSNHWETIIDWGDNWHYFLGISAPPSDWTELDFDQTFWPEGPSGFGYGDGDDATIVPAIISVFIRKTFVIDDLENIMHCILHVDFDDAFVAYLNGSEIARVNIGTPGIPPDFNAGADTLIEAQIYNGGAPEGFYLNLEQTPLLAGENILALEVHNYDIYSSDMSLIPFLTLGMQNSPPDAVGVAEILEFSLPSLHTNFKISAAGESLVLTAADNTLLDSLFTGNIPTDHSLGRQPDGMDNWYIFDDSTPGAINNTVGYQGLCAEPVFSNPGGFYQGGLTLELESATPNAEIRYTMDCSVPDENSDLYETPIPIGETTVIRAIAFAAGYIPSEIATHSFLINSETDLPVISLSTDPDNLWNPDSGIYVMGHNAETDFPYFGANFWQDWERPVHIEFYEPTNIPGFSIDAGMKIFGGWSRGHPQKSLSIFARSQYGVGEIDYPIFPNLPFQTYEAIVLRNSGNDWEFTMMRDGMMTSLLNTMDIDLQAYRPAVVFLNGEYWGIHNIREKINEHFIASHHNVDPDDIDELEGNNVVIEGDAVHYEALLDYISSTDMSNPASYAYIKTQMNMDNYIDYQLSQIYFDNRDWPGNNIKFWRPRTTAGKWRWILYDTDFGFGIWDDGDCYYNTLAFATEQYGPDWPNPPWSTFLFRSLLENQEFTEDFINTYCDHLNTTFDPDFVQQHIDTVKQKIEFEMLNHANRWGQDVNQWNSAVNVLYFFAEHREPSVRSHLRSEFDLAGDGEIQLDVSSAEMGSIRVNSIIVDQFPWQGTYFQDVDIEIAALPAPGYFFTGWSGDLVLSDSVITISLMEYIEVIANFQPTIGYEEILIFNEINYNSADDFNPEDWVELHNAGNFSINVDGWEFRDSDDDHIMFLPEDYHIEIGGFLVLCKDTSAFIEHFPDVDNFIGNTGFGLSGSGELIRLFNADGEMVDYVVYDDNYPWPTEPDGDGATLELINPNLDNEDAANWAASLSHGTPGAENSTFILICSHNGDVNLDGEVTVLDIVVLVGYILDELGLDDAGICNADVVTDDAINILDLVAIVALILEL